MVIAQTVKDAWHENLRVTLALLDHLDTKSLQAKTPGGGYTVAQHLAHITASTKFWGMDMDEQGLSSLPNLFPEDADDDDLDFEAELDLRVIREVITDTSDRVIESCEAASSKGHLPHTSLDAYLIHMMVHNAHHRGQIMLALKTAGHELPDDEKIWGPWRGVQ